MATSDSSRPFASGSVLAVHARLTDQGDLLELFVDWTVPALVTYQLPDTRENLVRGGTALWLAYRHFEVPLGTKQWLACRPDLLIYEQASARTFEADVPIECDLTLSVVDQFRRNVFHKEFGRPRRWSDPWVVPPPPKRPGSKD